MSTLQQTLYAASDRETFTHDLLSGTIPTYPATQTPAQTHDGSNATRDIVRTTGDGDAAADVFAGVRWTMDSCTFAGTIDKVVVRLKAVSSDAFGGQSFDLFPWWADSERGNVIPPLFVDDSGAVWLEWTLTTNPLTSAAWTAAAINAYKWGWSTHLLTADENMSTFGSVCVYEYEVQVWGSSAPPSQTVTPSSVGAVGGVGAASVACGAVSVAPESAGAGGEGGAVAVACGACSVTPESVGADGSTGVAGVEVGVRVASTVTVLPTYPDGASSSEPLRASNNELRDGSLDTYRSDIHAGAYSGSLSVACDSIGVDDIAGSGVIGGVVVHAFARVEAEDEAALVNAASFSTAHRTVAMVAVPPTGRVGATAFAECVSPVIATVDGTNPWTWSNVYAELTGLMASVVVVSSGGSVRFDVAELWVEVLGEVGPASDEVRLTRAVGDLRAVSEMTHALALAEEV